LPSEINNSERDEFRLNQYHPVIASAAQQSIAVQPTQRWIAALRLQ
jgi:hypothetical protein